MKILVLICGKKRTGKDTVAKIIQRERPGSEIIEMPERIKECAAETIGITRAEFDTYKDDAVIRIETKGGKILREVPLRAAAINLGNKMKAPFSGKEFWVEERIIEVDKRFSESDLVIVTGMRLKEEMDKFKHYFSLNPSVRVKVIKTERPEFSMPPDGTELDRTETEVESATYDYLLEAENLHSLETKTLEILEYL